MTENVTYSYYLIEINEEKIIMCDKRYLFLF